MAQMQFAIGAGRKTECRHAHDLLMRCRAAKIKWPMRTLDCETDIEAAVPSLLAFDPRFAAVTAAHAPPPLRRTNIALDGLLRIITDQLISRQAGIAIWR